ncbi:TatD family hydrolase [Oceanivirga salmonicida]|uniref:TatD family hydrolase n=1 Tax=Oceanivirga salmonicida TaxID=1769291 RepID=UPI00082B0383|nr:TatD family hydrolase [Oceanivirga salmonicida]
MLQDKNRKLVDAHCHLNDSKYDTDIHDIIENINENMEFVVCSGWDYDSSLEAIKFANENAKIYASIGFHPTDISTMTDEKLSHLEKLARTNPKIVGIGEIGLDYHWMTDPKDIQIAGFIRQIEMVRKLNKAIVIHTRDAIEDTINILKKYNDVGGILHCYPGTYEQVKDILDRYYVSVGGVLTFKNNRKTSEMVSKIPLDRIVLETDSPYLTPEPYRGKRNNPIFTEYVAKKIADIKGISYEEVVETTTINAYKGYKLWK